MSDPEYNEQIESLKDMFQKAEKERTGEDVEIQHGLGLGYTPTAEEVAEKYLLRGEGTYAPEPIHKTLFPDLDSVVVRLAWKDPGGWRRNVFANQSSWSNEDEDKAITEWRDNKYPDRKGQEWTLRDREEWNLDVEEGDPDAEYVERYLMIDVIFKGEFEPLCLDIDHCFFPHGERDGETGKIIYSEAPKPDDVYKDEHCNKKCRGSEHFGFKCKCTDHGGSFRKKRAI